MLVPQRVGFSPFPSWSLNLHEASSPGEWKRQDPEPDSIGILFSLCLRPRGAFTAMDHPSLATGRAALSASPFIGITGGEEVLRRCMCMEEVFNPSPVRQEGLSGNQQVDACRFPDVARFSMHRHFSSRGRSEEYCYGWRKTNE